MNVSDKGAGVKKKGVKSQNKARNTVKNVKCFLWTVKSGLL